MSKNRVIVETVLAGKSMSATAAQYGVSKVWVHKLVRRWREGGWDAVEVRSTRPKNSPNAVSEVVIGRIIAVRTELVADGCDAGPHTIRALLLRELETVPSVTTIWRILTRAGLVTPEPRKRPKHAYLRFQADLPNECWQSDFTHWKLANGTGVEILLWLDDHSRFLLSATAHKAITGPIVLDTFRANCASQGTPQSTLTDNGMVFTTRFRNGPNSFEAELARLGVEQKNGQPNHPQTQGKVERLNQTLKRWLTPRPAHTLAELQRILDEFVAYYNTRRPHRSLRGRTPADAYQARAKATPVAGRTHFRIRDDKVYANGNVTLRRAGRMHHIQLGHEHAGKPIRMLIHDLHVIVIDTATGEILRELNINPDRDSQPRGVKPGPKPGTPRTPQK